MAPDGKKHAHSDKNALKKHAPMFVMLLVTSKVSLFTVKGNMKNIADNTHDDSVSKLSDSAWGGQFETKRSKQKYASRHRAKMRTLAWASASWRQRRGELIRYGTKH